MYVALDDFSLLIKSVSINYGVRHNQTTNYIISGTIVSCLCECEQWQRGPFMRPLSCKLEESVGLQYKKCAVERI